MVLCSLSFLPSSFLPLVSLFSLAFYLHVHAELRIRPPWHFAPTPFSNQEDPTTSNLRVTRIRDLNLSRSRTLAGETCTSGDRSHSPSYSERSIITTKARCPLLKFIIPLVCYPALSLSCSLLRFYFHLSPSNVLIQSAALSTKAISNHSATQWRLQAKAMGLLKCQISVCSWHLFRFFFILTLPRVPYRLFFVPLFVSSFANISVQKQWVMQYSGTPQLLLLVLEQLPGPSTTPATQGSASPCLSKSKHCISPISPLLYSPPLSSYSHWLGWTPYIKHSLGHQYTWTPRFDERSHIRATTTPQPDGNTDLFLHSRPPLSCCLLISAR